MGLYDFGLKNGTVFKLLGVDKLTNALILIIKSVQLYCRK